MPSKKTAENKGNQSYAVIETGGKQYGVVSGMVIRIETLPGKKVGDSVTFDKVLLVDDGTAATIGTPYIAGAHVAATVKKEGRGAKVSVVKYKPKSRYLKQNGHRQQFMEVSIDSIA